MHKTPQAGSRTERIAILNDRCRQGLDRGSRTVITRNCLARLTGDGGLVAELLAQAAIMAAVRRASFDRDSPERDMGAVTVGEVKIVFKIDLYDPGLV
ncbi:DUF3768 domain-containing protein, partial [Sphingobium indicum]|uniref:DUF3768 domain-containing protein n=1 Tax=Sphingobium indicum TaxID=332055 RepID=UPI00055EBADF